MTEHEDFFGGEDLPAEVNMTIGPPQRYPSNMEIGALRYQFVKQLEHSYGAVEAYAILKLLDKLINDDGKSKNGALDHLREQVRNELQASGNKIDLRGAKLAWTTWRKTWIYPQNVIDLQNELASLEAELERQVDDFRKTLETEMNISDLRERVKIAEDVSIADRSALEGEAKKIIKVTFK